MGIPDLTVNSLIIRTNYTIRSRLTVSADGSVIVGNRSVSEDNQPFRWTEETGAADLDIFPSNDEVYTNDISADGTHVVGYEHLLGYEAYRWNSVDGAIRLNSGNLPEVARSLAYGVSADGQRVVGRYEGYLDSSLIQRAFYWTETEGIVNLEPPTQGSQIHNGATAISTDGSVIVGFSGSLAVRWTETEGEFGLGSVEGIGSGTPLAVSGDGSAIVGAAFDFINHEVFAFIWDEAGGMSDLKSVLTNDYGLDLTGWTLTSARDISDDGLTIVGDGINPNGDQEGWVVRLPEPSSFTLLVLVSLAWRRR